MTIKIPKPNFFDYILKVLGKKRAVKISDGVYEKFGPYVYAKAQKENFWQALLRPKGVNPPKDYIYIDEA